MEHIAAAVDTTERSARVATIAARWAARMHARLTLLHVTTSASVTPSPVDRLRRTLQRYVADVDVVCAAGPLAATLDAQVARHAVDLLVVPGAGQDRIGAIVGGTLLPLLRRTRVPVLVAGDRCTGQAAGQVRHVALATDLAPEAAAGLAVAETIAAAWHAALDVVHVLRPGADTQPAAIPAPLASLARATGRVQARPLVLFGTDVARTLAYEAATRRWDVIVVGCHRRGALYELVVGSTTEALVRIGPCLVAVVPPPAPADGRHPP